MYFGCMKSLNVNLFLPDTVHSTIFERAKTEGIDPAHYCSSLIIESLGNGGIVKTTPIGLPFVKHGQSANGINGTHSSLSDTLEQILAVCRCVWQDKLEFADAVRKTAKNFKVNETTIRDKCTRRISLFPHSQIDTEKFLNMLAQPSVLRDYLCRRFPKYSREIIQRFEQIAS
jgi:hypothetical protein